MAERFGRLAAGFHTSPKGMEAGLLGRAVFCWAIDLNAANYCKGRIPIGYFGPAHMSRLLGITPEQAVDGLGAAVAARLLRVDELHVVMVGWNEDEWGNGLSTKRVQAFREKHSKDTNGETVTNVSPNDETVKRIREEKRREEKRLEKKRSSKSASPTTPLPFTIQSLGQWFKLGAGDAFAEEPFDRTLSKPLTAVIRSLGDVGVTATDIESAGRVARNWKLSEPLTWAWLAKGGNLAGAIAKGKPNGRPTSAGPKPPPLQLLVDGYTDSKENP